MVWIPGTTRTGTRLYMPLVLFDSIVTSTVSGYPRCEYVNSQDVISVPRKYRIIIADISEGLQYTVQFS
jgi:hypothetical protein